MTLHSCDSYTSSVFSWYGSLSLQKVADANHYGDLPQRTTSASKKSSVFYSLRRLDIWVSGSALDLSTAPSIPPTFLTICNRKTITQSAEIPIFVGETRRSHICSHHGSSLGLAPGQADSISGLRWWCDDPWEAGLPGRQNADITGKMKTVQRRIVILEMICLNLRAVKGFYFQHPFKDKGYFPLIL